jgi:GT2 family glycosyltransferase
VPPVFIVASLLLLGWCLQLALALRIRASVPPLSSVTAPPRDAWPTVSMVVPARDEGLHVEEALRSKLACGYPSLQIVAVDDRSRDNTGAIFDRIAASDPRVTAVHLRELPAGWLGKLHAMAQGAERATGEWVLFSDADVHIEPGALEKIVAWAEAERVDLVAVFPQMRPTTPAIDAALSCLLRVLAIAGRTWTANRDGEGVGGGVGAFNLIRRSTLERIDALRLLRMEVIDDVALGALAKQSGARCRFLAGRGSVHLEFMDTLSALGRSADKGGGALGFSWWRPLVFAALPLTLDLVLPAAAVASGGAAAAIGAATFAVATLTHYLITDHFDGPRRGAALWPLGAVLTSAFTLRAGLRAWRRQGIAWRDTFYPRDALEGGRRFDLATMRVDTSPRPQRSPSPGAPRVVCDVCFGSPFSWGTIRPCPRTRPRAARPSRKSPSPFSPRTAARGACSRCTPAKGSPSSMRPSSTSPPKTSRPPPTGCSPSPAR